MSTVFTVVGTGWGWTEETSRVGEPQINLRIHPSSIPSRANVPGNAKIGPTIPKTGWEVRVFDALTQQLIAYVPKWRNLEFSIVLSEISAGSVEMEMSDPIFLNIATNVLNREAIWAIYYDNLNVFSFRNEEIAEGLVEESQLKTITFMGRQVGKQLEDGVVLPQGYIEGGTGWNSLKRSWTGEQAMQVFRELLAEAQARGAVGGITHTFTNTVDSNGVPWTDSTDLNIEVGETMLSVLQSCAEVAGADWIVTPSGELQVGIPLGDDLTNVVQFQVAHDQISFTRNHRRTDLKNVVYVQAGEEGRSVLGDSKDTASIGTWGRREHYVTSSDAMTRSAASAFAQKVKNTMRLPQGEVTISVLPDHEFRRVFFDYNVGDWIGVTSNDSRVASPIANPQYADGVTTSGSATFTSQSANFNTTDIGKTITGAGIPNGTTILSVTNATTVTMSANATATATNVVFGVQGRKAGYRVRGIAINVDDSNTTLVNLTCESLLMHNLAKLRKAIESGGGAGSFTSVGGGTSLDSGPTPGQTVAAAATLGSVPQPTNLLVTPDSGIDGVWVDISWDAPNEPASETDPVTDYEVHVIPVGLPEKKIVVRTRETSVRVVGLFPNQDYIVYLYAITRLARTSTPIGGVGAGEFETQGDTSIPATMTGAPTLYVAMRSATVTWVETGMPADVVNGNGTYIVEIDDNTGFTNANGRRQSKSASGTIVSFTNLTPPPLPSNINDPLTVVTYYARVKPVDASGNAATGWSPTSSGQTQARIDQVDIGKNAIIAPFIKTGEINTDHIATAGLDAGHIKFGTMDGDRIATNTLSAQTIESSDITAATISVKGTGALQIGRTATPFNYVRIDPDSIAFFAGGSAAFTGGTATLRFWNKHPTDAAQDGTLALAGSITSGATITGGTIQGATVRAGATNGTANPRVILDADGIRVTNSGGTVITRMAASTAGGFSPGKLYTSDADITGTITATGGSIANLTITGNLTMSTNGVFRTAASGQRIEMTTATLNRIDFFSGSQYETASGRITVSTDGNSSNLHMSAPNLGSGTGFVTVGGSRTGTYVALQADNNRGFFANANWVDIFHNVTITLNAPTVSVAGALSADSISSGDYGYVTASTLYTSGRVLAGTTSDAGSGENVVLGGGSAGIRFRQRGRTHSDNAFSYVLYGGSDEFYVWNAQTNGVSVAFQTNHVTRFQKDADGNWANSAVRTTGVTSAMAWHSTGNGGHATCVELWSGDSVMRFYDQGMGWEEVHMNVHDTSAASFKREIRNLTSASGLGRTAVETGTTGATSLTTFRQKVMSIAPKRYKLRRPNDPAAPLALSRHKAAYEAAMRKKDDPTTDVLTRRNLARSDAKWDADEIGFLAEDIAPFFPEVCSFNDDGTPRGIRYGRLTTVLWKMNQEQDEVIQSLEATVRSLTTRIEALERPGVKK